jgi:hypothetical protein
MGETRPKEVKKLKADVVVVGAGPAGLMSALLLAEENKRVILVEKRSSEFIRPQLVHLTSKTAERLQILELHNPQILSPKEGLSEENFQKQLLNRKEHIAIKDIQRFLKRRIDDNKNILCLFNTSLEDVDFKEGQVSVTTPQQNFKIVFEDLIAADGNSRHTVNLVNKNLIEKKADPIEFDETFDSAHKNFISCYFKVKKKNGESMNISDRFVDRHYTEDGIDYIYYHHASLAKTNNKQLKFYVTSCVSDKDAKEFQENKEKGIEHLIKIAKQTFPDDEFEISLVDKSEKHGLLKDNLKYQTFQRLFQQAKTAGLLINGHHFCLVGDAFKNPDFYQGIGVNAAIEHALLTVALILGYINLELFNKKSKQMGLEQLEGTQNLEHTLQYKLFFSMITLNLEMKINELKKRQEQSKTLYSRLTGLNKYAMDIEKLEEVRNILNNYPINEVEEKLAEVEIEEPKKRSFCPQLFKPTILPETKKQIRSTLYDISHFITQLKSTLQQEKMMRNSDKNEEKEEKKETQQSLTHRKKY